MSEALIDLVERAYDLSTDRDTWLGQLGEATEATGFAPLGMFAYEFVVRDGRPVVGGLFCHRTHDRIPALLDVMIERADSDVVEAFYVQGPRCGSLTDAAEHAGRPDFARVGTSMFEAFGGFSDMFVLVIHGLGGRRVHVNLPQPTVLGRSSAARIERWSRITSHVSAGFRLRCALAESEAVFDTHGRELHYAAGAKSHREALHAAVRARAKAQSQRDEAALEMWKGLVDGRWSLVDHVDTDGKRFVVARPNEPDARDPRALTPRERHVARLLASGCSTKLVAYDLGLSVGAISSHIHAIQRKLGARNRAHLVALLRAMPGEALGGEQD